MAKTARVSTATGVRIAADVSAASAAMWIPSRVVASAADVRITSAACAATGVCRARIRRSSLTNSAASAALGLDIDCQARRRESEDADQYCQLRQSAAHTCISPISRRLPTVSVTTRRSRRHQPQHTRPRLK